MQITNQFSTENTSKAIHKGAYNHGQNLPVGPVILNVKCVFFTRFSNTSATTVYNIYALPDLTKQVS